MGSSPTTGANLRPYNHQIGLDTQHATPPVDAYVTVDDSLWIMISATTPVTTVTVVARIILPDGSIVPNIWTLSPVSTRAATYVQQRLPEGFILSISATANLAVSAGQAFVALYISRSLPGSFQAAQLLCSGYTYNNQPVSWPGGINRNSTDEAGQIRVIVGTTPGAGGEISETVPANSKWRLQSIMATIVTSATAATRDPALVIDDGIRVIAMVTMVPPGIVAGTTQPMSWGVGLNPLTNFAGAVLNPLPSPFFLLPGWRFRTVTLGIQANDQWSSPAYSLEEWVMP